MYESVVLWQTAHVVLPYLRTFDENLPCSVEGSSTAWIEHDWMEPLNFYSHLTSQASLSWFFGCCLGTIGTIGMPVAVEAWISNNQTGLPNCGCIGSVSRTINLLWNGLRRFNIAEAEAMADTAKLQLSWSRANVLERTASGSRCQSPPPSVTNFSTLGWFWSHLVTFGHIGHM